MEAKAPGRLRTERTAAVCFPWQTEGVGACCEANLGHWRGPACPCPPAACPVVVRRRFAVHAEGRGNSAASPHSAGPTAPCRKGQGEAAQSLEEARSGWSLPRSVLRSPTGSSAPGIPRNGLMCSWQAPAQCLSLVPALPYTQGSSSVSRSLTRAAVCREHRGCVPMPSISMGLVGLLRGCRVAGHEPCRHSETSGSSACPSCGPWAQSPSGWAGLGAGKLGGLHQGHNIPPVLWQYSDRSWLETGSKMGAVTWKTVEYAKISFP